MNSVRLAKLNELRFAQDPVPMRTLRNWAAEGKIPGAFKPYGTGKWRVDLDAFDMGIADQIGAAESDASYVDLLNEAESILEQFA
jgi:hypothetical protein